MWYLCHLRFRRVFGGEGGMQEARGIMESAWKNEQRTVPFERIVDAWGWLSAELLFLIAAVLQLLDNSSRRVLYSGVCP